MRTYLVTGGAGFIGSNYIHYMFKKYDNEIRIINVDKLTYAGNLENLKDIEDRENYTFVKADICDADAINKIFEENEIDRPQDLIVKSVAQKSKNKVLIKWHQSQEDLYRNSLVPLAQVSYDSTSLISINTFSSP